MAPPFWKEVLFSAFSLRFGLFQQGVNFRKIPRVSHFLILLDSSIDAPAAPFGPFSQEYAAVSVLLSPGTSFAASKICFSGPFLNATVFPITHALDIVPESCISFFSPLYRSRVTGFLTDVPSSCFFFSSCFLRSPFPSAKRTFFLTLVLRPSLQVALHRGITFPTI